MKSEERHEMQTNSLAVFLMRLPEILREHSTKVLLVVALILLAIAGLRYKRTAEQNRQMAITQGLMQARVLADQLVQSPAGMMPPEMVKTLPGRIEQARAELADALDDTTGPQIVRAANAQVTLGDLYLGAAAFQEGKDRDQSLDQAVVSYNAVFSRFKENNLAVRDAHFGLAAAYINRGDFKAAAEQYNAVKSGANFTAGDKLLADQGLERMKDIESPLLLLPATQPVVPASQPALLGPVGPAAPTTAPATAPAH